MLQKNNTSLFDKSLFKVVTLFFDSPNKTYHLRQLASLTKLSTTAVNSACTKLVELGIIKLTKGLTKEFKADLESKSFYNHKSLLNIYSLKNSGLIEELIDKYNPEVITLFGSYSKGEDIEQSDIDLLIISKRDDEIDLTAYEELLNRKIRLYLLYGLGDSESAFINNLCNGVILHGYLKVL